MYDVFFFCLQIFKIIMLCLFVFVYTAECEHTECDSYHTSIFWLSSGFWLSNYAYYYTVTDPSKLHRMSSLFNFYFFNPICCDSILYWCNPFFIPEIWLYFVSSKIQLSITLKIIRMKISNDVVFATFFVGRVWYHHFMFGMQYVRYEHININECV